MNYCTKSDIEALLNLKFDSESQPTEAKVNLFITSISSELNMALMRSGLPSPATEENALEILKIYCGFGTAGLVAMTYGGNIENIGTTQGVYYRTEYKDFLKRLKDDPGMLDMRIISGPMIASTNVTDGYTPESVIEDRVGDDWTP